MFLCSDTSYFIVTSLFWLFWLFWLFLSLLDFFIIVAQSTRIILKAHPTSNLETFNDGRLGEKF
jgi:hypothetical protein